MDGFTIGLLEYIKGAMRSGCSDEEIAELMDSYAAGKKDLISVIRALMKIMEG